MNTTALSEEPRFIGERGDRIFVMLHRPSGAPRGRIVMCHALAEEKLWSHRVYVSFARAAAVAGFVVARFDMRGEGDSALEFEDSTMETRVADALTVLEFMERTVPHQDAAVMLGHRLGGQIAMSAAQRAGARVGRAVVWDPVYDPGEYFSQLLRSNLTMQMATDGKVSRNREILLAGLKSGESIVVDGYGLTSQLHEGMLRLSMESIAPALVQPTLLLEVAKGEQTGPSEDFRQNVAGNPGIQCRVVTEPPFWRETRQFHREAANFSAATLQWLTG